MSDISLSAVECERASNLISAEAATWRRLAAMRLTTDAERALFRQNASILDRVVANLEPVS